jgi:hypothetical protein
MIIRNINDLFQYLNYEVYNYVLHILTLPIMIIPPVLNYNAQLYKGIFGINISRIKINIYNISIKIHQCNMYGIHKSFFYLNNRTINYIIIRYIFTNALYDKNSNINLLNIDIIHYICNFLLQ